jgi:hypothetical protein
MRFMQVEGNDDPRIRKQFLAFTVTGEVTGHKLTEAFLSRLKECNLSLEKMHR